MSAMPTPGSMYGVWHSGTQQHLVFDSVRSTCICRVTRRGSAPTSDVWVAGRLGAGVHRTRFGFVTQHNAKDRSATCTIYRGAQHKSTALMDVRGLTCTTDTTICSHHHHPARPCTPVLPCLPMSPMKPLSLEIMHPHWRLPMCRNVPGAFGYCTPVALSFRARAAALRRVLTGRREARSQDSPPPFVFFL